MYKNNFTSKFPRETTDLLSFRTTNWIAVFWSVSNGIKWHYLWCFIFLACDWESLLFHSCSISKFDERSCFLYVLYNSDDFQLYFPSDLHCKGWAPPFGTLLKHAAKDNMREELQCHDCFDREWSLKRLFCEFVLRIIWSSATLFTEPLKYMSYYFLMYPVVSGSVSHVWPNFMNLSLFQLNKH